MTEDKIEELLLEFQGAFAELKTNVAAIKDYQEKQNGRVFELSDRFNALAAHSAEREESCPLLKPLADELATMKTETNLVKPWIRSGLLLALTLLTILVLLHADVFAKFFLR